MKKRSFLITSTLALSCFAMFYLNSCTKLAQALQYDLAMQTATVNITIPPYPDTTIAANGTQSNTYNVDSFIKANTANVLGVSNITSAKITSCVVTLLNPTVAENFANFKTCNASFHTNGNTTPFTVTIPNNPDVYSSTLTLPVDTTAELKGYLTGGSTFTYNLGGSLRRPTTDSLHATCTFTFKLHVQG